jgi:hypothetical protein
VRVPGSQEEYMPVRGEFFEGSHHRIEIMNGLIPLSRIEIIECFIVCLRISDRLSLELRKGIGIPKQDIVGDHPDGMIGIGVESRGNNYLCLPVQGPVGHQEH